MNPAGEGPITPAEMLEMFGTDMPVEAVQALWDADEGRTTGQVRAEVRRLGALRRREREQAEAVREIEAGWFKRLHEFIDAIKAGHPPHMWQPLEAQFRAYEAEHYAVVRALRQRLDLRPEDMDPPPGAAP